MRIRFLVALLIVFVLGVVSCNAFDRVTLVRVDPYQKILPEQQLFDRVADTVEVALGGSGSFQFVVRSSCRITNLSAEVVFETPATARLWLDGKVGYVGYVSASLPMPRPPVDVVSSPSRLYPDPVYELPAVDVRPDVAQPMWITINTLPFAPKGLYTARVVVSGLADGRQFTLSESVALKVYPVTLPRELAVSNWWYMSERLTGFLNDEGGTVPLYSTQYWQMLTMLAERMRECGQNTVDVSPLGHTDFTEQDGVYSFDFTKFDLIVELFRSHGVAERIEGSPLGTRLGNWESNFGLRVIEHDSLQKPVRVLYPVDDPKVKSFYSQFMPALTAHLKERGYWTRYAQHIADEPIDANAESYCRTVDFVKSFAPGLRTIEAVLTTKVADKVDVLVPQLNVLAANSDFFAERQRMGNEVWFYTCLVPQGEYANRLIELPLIKTRLLHWLNFRFGTTGYLHWGFNSWRGERVEMEDGRKYLVETSEVIAENGSTLPAGDFALVYPLEGRVHGSIRLQAMREGVDDHGLLTLLSQRNPQLADSLCRMVVRDWTDYDTNPATINRLRHIMFEELTKSGQ